MAYMQEPYVFSDGKNLHIGDYGIIPMELFDELVVIRWNKMWQSDKRKAFERLSVKPETCQLRTLNHYHKVTMSVFVSTAEPPEIKRLFPASGVPEKWGMDFLISGKMGLIGIQRKTIDDFLSSVRDGRLATQMIKSAEMKIKFMVVEGELLETRDGNLMTNWSTPLTVDQFTKMMLSVTLEGYQIWRTYDWQETCRFVNVVDEWAQKERHSTISGRGGPEKDPWGQGSDDKEAIFFLQGLPGIGPTTAKNLYNSWGVPLVWSVTEDDLRDVAGIGKNRAKRLIEFINGDMF